MLAALHITNLAVAPDPISPFVLLAASVDSLEDFYFDEEFAHAAIPDPDTLRRILQILDLKADKGLNVANMLNARLFALTVDIEVPVSDCRLLKLQLLTRLFLLRRWTSKVHATVTGVRPLVCMSFPSFLSMCLLSYELTCLLWKLGLYRCTTLCRASTYYIIIFILCPIRLHDRNQRVQCKA
jgi:hypothetical protein